MVSACTDSSGVCMSNSPLCCFNDDVSTIRSFYALNRSNVKSSLHKDIINTLPGQRSIRRFIWKQRRGRFGDVQLFQRATTQTGLHTYNTGLHALPFVIGRRNTELQDADGHRGAGGGAGFPNQPPAGGGSGMPPIAGGGRYVGAIAPPPGGMPGGTAAGAQFTCFTRVLLVRRSSFSNQLAAKLVLR